jgi:multidrug efflux pump subunit AcrA (membrane-fusion protein)
MGLTSQFGGKPKAFFLGTSSLLVLAAIPFFYLHFRQTQSTPSQGEPTVRVEKKKFTQTLRLNGTTLASRSFAVLAPKLEGAQVGSMIITKLAPAGTQVKKDDLLVEFDPQAQTKDYLDKKSAYEGLVSQG